MIKPARRPDLNPSVTCHDKKQCWFLTALTIIEALSALSHSSLTLTEKCDTPRTQAIAGPGVDVGGGGSEPVSCIMHDTMREEQDTPRTYNIQCA